MIVPLPAVNVPLLVNVPPEVIVNCFVPPIVKEPFVLMVNEFTFPSATLSRTGALLLVVVVSGITAFIIEVGTPQDQLEALFQLVSTLPFHVVVFVIVNVLVEVTFPQGEFPVAVNVSVTVPAVISALLGVYVASVKEVAFVKVPVPLEVHVTEVLLVAEAPSVIFTAPAVPQVETALPATTVG